MRQTIQHHAPRIDNHRITVRIAPVGMPPALRWRQHIGQILNRPRAQQRFPVRTPGGFGIGIMKPDGSGERILTEGFHNEGPTWAPNGRVLMFFRDSQGESGGPQLYTVDVTGYNERAVKIQGFASDPAWSPLLK